MPSGSLCQGDGDGGILWVRGVKRGPRQEPGDNWLDFYRFFGDRWTLK